MPALRPMGVGELADRCFALYRRQFPAYFSLAVLLHLPLQGAILWLAARAGLGLNRGESPARVLAATFGSGWLLLAYAVYFLLAYPALEGSVVFMTLRAALGEPVTSGAAVRFALRRLGALSLTALLWWVTAVAAAVPVFIVGLFLAFAGVLVAIPAGLLGGGATGGTAAGVITVFAVTLAVLLASLAVGLFGLLYAPVLLSEGRGYFGAIVRSWGLVWGNWWRTLAITALLFSLSLIVALALQGSLSILNALSPSRWWALAIMALSAVFRTLMLPLHPIGVSLLYLDLRARREGLDIELGARGLRAVLPRLLEARLP